MVEEAGRIVEESGWMKDIVVGTGGGRSGVENGCCSGDRGG